MHRVWAVVPESGVVGVDEFADGHGLVPADDLKQLESAHILTRVPYREPGSRARDEYRLTEAGEDLLPVFLSLVQWGDKHLQSGRAPLSFIDADADTGQPVEVRVTTDTDTPETCSADIEIRRSGTARRH